MSKKVIVKLASQVFIVVLFLIVTAVTLFYSFGYRYDRETYEMVPTGIVRISSYLQGVEVFVNDELFAEGLPVNMHYLNPGNYVIKVMKDGFKPWVAAVEVKAGDVSYLPNVLLVPEDLGENLELLIDFGGRRFHEFVNEKVFGYVDDKGVLSLVRFTPEGSVISNYDFAFNDLMVIDSVRAGYLTVRIDDESYAHFRLDSPNLNEGYLLPKGIENLRILSTRGFYLREGKLFSFNLPGFLQGGDFHRVIGESIYDGVKSFEVVSEDGNLFLMEFLDGRKVLGVLNLQKKVFNEIDSSVGEFDLSDDGKYLLYSKGDEVWRYDLAKKDVNFVTRFSIPVSELEWHSDSYHVWLIDGKELKLCVFDLDYCNVVSEVDEGSFLYRVPGTDKVTFQKGGALYALEL